jgi:hypothetical protein
MDRPNILFLLSDEHNYRFLSCLSSEQGGEPCRTPALDRLAAQGVRFDAAYCQMPLCTPSGISLLAGRHVHRCPVLWPETPTFASHLGARSIRVLLEQQTSAGLDVLSFSHKIRVVRGENLVVADDWTLKGRGGVSLQAPSAGGPVFSDSEALIVRIDKASPGGWRLTFNAPEPVAADEYRALRFAVQVDPAQFEGVQGPLSAVLLPWVQRPLQEEGRLEQGSAVDLVADELLDPLERGWQVVEIPLEAFELGAFGLEREPIGSIRFLGRLEGEFLLDDLRLVSHVQRPGDTAVLEELGNAPAQFELGQSYPNPFNGEVVIPFALARAGAVGLSLYDLLGQRVAVLAEGWHPAGRHEVRWDPRARQELASGVYFYRLQTASGVKFGKLILLQ